MWAARAPPVQDPGRGADGNLRLHRGLVQSAPPPLRARLPVADRLRTLLWGRCKPNIEVRGRHTHRWAAEKRGGRRVARRRGRGSKTFKLSGLTLTANEGWGRKAGIRPTLMRKVGGS